MDRRNRISIGVLIAMVFFAFGSVEEDPEIVSARKAEREREMEKSLQMIGDVNRICQENGVGFCETLAKNTPDSETKASQQSLCESNFVVECLERYTKSSDSYHDAMMKGEKTPKEIVDQITNEIAEDLTSKLK